MTISSDLKYAISMWKQYKLRERIAISLTFENPKLLSYVQLNKEMREHMDKDEDFPPELESKIKAQDSEYLDNCEIQYLSTFRNYKCDRGNGNSSYYIR